MEGALLKELIRELALEQAGDKGWLFLASKLPLPPPIRPREKPPAKPLTPQKTPVVKQEPLAEPPAPFPAILASLTEEVLPPSSTEKRSFSAFQLQPLQATSYTPQVLFPKVVLHIPEGPQDRFVENICHGVSQRLTWTKAVTHEEWITNPIWQEALDRGDIRLVIIQDPELAYDARLQGKLLRNAQGELTLGKAKVLFLLSPATYVLHASLKHHLWQAIQHYVET